MNDRVVARREEGGPVDNGAGGSDLARKKDAFQPKALSREGRHASRGWLPPLPPSWRARGPG